MRIDNCDYAIVCRARKALQYGQCLPHYDGHEKTLFASVHYIQGPQTAGTAFYRHKRTGFETITTQRREIYQAAIEKDISVFGPPPKTYFYGDDERYEMIGEISARPDRLILYHGNMLHSGCIHEAVSYTHLTLPTTPYV